MAATKFHFDGPKALPLESARTRRALDPLSDAAWDARPSRMRPAVGGRSSEVRWSLKTGRMGAVSDLDKPGHPADLVIGKVVEEGDDPPDPQHREDGADADAHQPAGEDHADGEGDADV